MRRLGLLGGTFDPVHYGHLRPAVEVRAALGLDAVHLIPCRVSPHRDAPHADGGERMAMLEAAVAGWDDMIVDGRELGREGASYTIDTLLAIAAEQPDAGLYLIIGSDAAAAFERWHRWSDILELAHLVVTERPGWPAALPGGLAERRVEALAGLDRWQAGGVLVQPVTQLDISASAVRALAAAGGDLRCLVPEPVRARIAERALYTNQENANPDGDRSAG